MAQIKRIVKSKELSGVNLKTKKTQTKKTQPRKTQTKPSIMIDPKVGLVYVLGGDLHRRLELIEILAPTWQKSSLQKSERECLQFISDNGPVWIFQSKIRLGPFSHGGRLEDSIYSWTRDQVGSIWNLVKAYQLDQLHVHFSQVEDEQIIGGMVGMQMAMYQFKDRFNKKNNEKSVESCAVKYFLNTEQGNIEVPKELSAQAASISESVNAARHLVNLPPNFLNPKTFAEWVQSEFKNNKSVQITIWDEKRLQKENMNLHLAVGQGAVHPPCLVHIRYRPSQNKGKGPAAKPVAFVGKGVTFDTGGLDIKPSSGMRLMKKDMGGAAAVAGLAMWAHRVNYSKPLDFYLALAENSVDGKSFRPSDVITARNGLQVEIHNTDAEGRLVLADALDVAVTQTKADEPEMVIDVATLTGAIKVALGADLAGLFTNDDDLAEKLSQAGQAAGDLSWRMPLLSKYNGASSSHFADMVNAVDGFGGAITAALFLEKFVKQKSWAHLDIYAWADKAQGALSSSGGSGQAVQALIHFLQMRE